MTTAARSRAPRAVAVATVLAALLVGGSALAQVQRPEKLLRGERLALCLDSGIRTALLTHRGSIQEKEWTYSHAAYHHAEGKVLVYLKTFSGMKEIEIEQAKRDLQAFATLLEHAKQDCGHLLNKPALERSIVTLYMVSKASGDSFRPEYQLVAGTVAKVR